MLKEQELDYCSLLALGLMVALGLLRKQHGLDVGQDAALSDGDFAQQLVELLVVADGQLQVAWNDAGLLVVPGRVARQLQDLGCQVLQHRRQIHRRTRPDTLGIVPFAKQTVNSAHGKLKSSPRRTCLGLSPGFATLFSASRHFNDLTITTNEEKKRNTNLANQKQLYL